MIDVDETLSSICYAIVMDRDAAAARKILVAALATSWDQGAAKGDAVGMTAITINPMHANPYQPTTGDDQ